MVRLTSNGCIQMKTTAKLILVSAFLALASQASADCYAEYKAKKPSPLQLHVGVVKLPNGICSDNSAIRSNVANRISVGGWTLLNVMSVFGPEGLAQRKARGGEFFLKY